MSIEVAQSLLPGKINTPLDARTRISALAEMATIANPFLGMEVYCTATGKTYKITALKSKIIGTMNVANALIDTYEEIPDAGALEAVTSRLEALEEGSSCGSAGSANYATSAGFATSAGYANSAGSAASAGYAASVPWGGIMEKPETFPPDKTLLTSAIASGGSAGQILTHTGSGCSWQEGGATGAVCSRTQISELNESGYIEVSGIPVLIETNRGNIYPVSGGFVSLSGNTAKIDPAPYLLADGSASFSRYWYIYTIDREG